MATQIANGDYLLDSHGRFISGDELDDLVQRAISSLRVKKGSFPLNPNFGSELHTLNIHSATDDVIKAHICEALAQVSELEVASVQRTKNPADNALAITVTLNVRHLNKSILLSI